MTGDTKTPTATRPRRRWPKILLAASLTLNVLVLSIVLGAVFRDGRDYHKAPPPDRMVPREGGVLPFFEAMPRDARKRMAEAFRAEGYDRRPDRAVLAAEFSDFVAALRADPFDPATLEAVLDVQHARVADRVTAGRMILIDQIAAMDPTERAAFTDALESRFQGAMDRERNRPDRGRDHH